MTLVKEIMKKEVRIALKSTSIVDAVKLMKKHKIGSVVVVSDSEALGIVTSTDILYKAIAEGKDLSKTTIEEIMSFPLIVTSPEATLEEAAKLMTKNEIKKLPAIDEKGALVGIVTTSDLVAYSPEYSDVLVNLVVPTTQERMGS